MDQSIERATPMEFFKERIEDAIVRQRVEPSEDSRFYLTQLLETFVRPDRLYAQAGVGPNQPLGRIFSEAVLAEGRRRFVLLKLTGDLALFLVGFLSESLNRALVTPDYYVGLGGKAYGVLSQEHRRLHDLFAELAENFARFADVLTEVSEHCTLADSGNLLRLYERWRTTGSARSAELLREQGILVVPTSDAVH